MVCNLLIIVLTFYYSPYPLPLYTNVISPVLLVLVDSGSWDPLHAHGEIFNYIGIPVAPLFIFIPNSYGESPPASESPIDPVVSYLKKYDPELLIKI